VRGFRRSCCPVWLVFGVLASFTWGMFSRQQKRFLHALRVGGSYRPPAQRLDAWLHSSEFARDVVRAMLARRILCGMDDPAGDLIATITRFAGASSSGTDESRAEHRLGEIASGNLRVRTDPASLIEFLKGQG